MNIPNELMIAQRVVFSHFSILLAQAAFCGVSLEYVTSDICESIIYSLSMFKFLYFVTVNLYSCNFVCLIFKPLNTGPQV